MKMLTSDVPNGANRPKSEETLPPVDVLENAQEVQIIQLYQSLMTIASITGCRENRVHCASEYLQSIHLPLTSTFNKHMKLLCSFPVSAGL